MQEKLDAMEETLASKDAALAEAMEQVESLTARCAELEEMNGKIRPIHDFLAMI